jgi:hypothetical protein
LGLDFGFEFGVGLGEIMEGRIEAVGLGFKVANFFTLGGELRFSVLEGFASSFEAFIHFLTLLVEFFAGSIQIPPQITHFCI